MPKHDHKLPPIPPSFTVKKNAILGSLAAPSSSYTDASPKGSVDEAIRGLIDRVNALEGIVTTSSCAGRVSVFAEGRKESKDGINWATNSRKDAEDASGRGSIGFETRRSRDGPKQKIVPGGKGLGGRWLFVSHEPLAENLKGEDLAHIFGLMVDEGNSGVPDQSTGKPTRLVRFQFEPMILHIMTASLHHAQPVLAAAINAGFRESGVQSLKNLYDANSFPMVAVRTSGLAFESLIGYVNEIDDGLIRPLVDHRYLEILAAIASERFFTNAKRIERFEEALMAPEKLPDQWESAESRGARKKAEGLAYQASIVKKTDTQATSANDEPDVALSFPES